MSVVLDSFETACHRPCPDMPYHSLNAAQKAKGLARLQEVRADLREKQLQPLRKQRTELATKANHEDTSTLERTRLIKEIDRIDRAAQRITERWS